MISSKLTLSLTSCLTRPVQFPRQGVAIDIIGVGTGVPSCLSTRAKVTRSLVLVRAAILDFWLKCKAERGCVPNLSWRGRTNKKLTQMANQHSRSFPHQVFPVGDCFRRQLVQRHQLGRRVQVLERLEELVERDIRECGLGSNVVMNYWHRRKTLSGS